MHELKKKAFMGVLWSGGNLIFNQVIALVVKLVLVRLLIPDEFGLAAMAAVVISSLDLISAFGIGSAFVRDNESDPVKAKNTLFYLHATAHFLIALIGFFIAPYVAVFFGDKISDPAVISSLVLAIRILALAHLTTMFLGVPSAVLNKNLRFKEQVIANLLGFLTYGFVAIILAFLGMGFWAIIIAQAANGVVRRITIFSFCPFIPSLIFDKKIAKDYINFGKNSFISTIADIIITNGDDTLIGRLLGAAALGFYSIGQHFAGVVATVVAGVITGVAFPVFAKLQSNKEAYQRAFFKIFRLRALFALPSIGGAMVLGPEIVKLVFGEKWLPVLVPFYILSVAALLNQLVPLAGPVLNSLNKPHIPRNNRLIQMGVFVVLAYPFTKMWGLAGMSLVMASFSIVSLIYLSPKMAKVIPGFYSNLFKVLGRIVPITALMMIIVYFSKKLVYVNLFWLFSLVFLGVVVYFVPMWIVDKDLKWDVQEGWSVLKEKFSFLR